ncbi:hypothetical protein MSAN_02514200 [Mycena sanguinolenta]|uniref:Uncharacterized protein n=1 Tax=Mycena sanguinolenta TaxID=230812 RepID=A0A8H6TY49_9AGAR|nr:hypothetical protein MSAN_02514200 [Mycena sanguinolenta]
MLWIHNDSLKAKGQGIIILTSSYIPDIETQDELYISENETVDLVQGPSTNPVINEDAGPNQVHFSLAAVKSPKEEKTKPYQKDIKHTSVNEIIDQSTGGHASCFSDDRFATV